MLLFLFICLLIVRFMFKKCVIVQLLTNLHRVWANEPWLKKKRTRRSRWCAGNHRHLMSKCQNKLKFVAAILDLWRPYWIDNEYLINLYSIYGNNHLYQFWYFYHKVNDRYTNCHILQIFYNADRKQLFANYSIISKSIMTKIKTHI